MSAPYFREKLGLAVSSLARGDRLLRERVLAAMNMVARLTTPAFLDAVPQEVRRRIEWIDGEASKHGSYKESVDALTDERVQQIAEEIVWLYGWACESAPLYHDLK